MTTGHRHRPLRRDRGRRRPQRPAPPPPTWAGRGPAHAGARAPRDRGRLLRHRGDRPRLPRLHDLLHREHAAARGHPRPGPRRATACAWSPAIPTCRCPSPTEPSLPWWAERERAGGGDRAHLPEGRRDLVAGRRQAEEAGPLPAAVLPRAARPTPAPAASRACASCCSVARRFWGISRRRDRGDGLVPDRQPRRVPRPELRVGEGQDAASSPTTSTASTAGPTTAGTALGLLFHLLSGGEHEVQGFMGHVMGGHGRHHPGHGRGLPAAGRRDPHRRPVARIDGAAAGASRAWRSRTARRSTRPLVLSNADPKRTFLGLVEAADLPAEFREAVRARSRWTARAPR